LYEGHLELLMPYVDQSKKLGEATFGLALSGGGYRASLFHLGALRRLNEIGWLNKIDRITAVSGGSLLVGYLLSNCPEVFNRSKNISSNDWQKLVSNPVHRFVQNDLRTIQTLKNFSINFFTRRAARLDHNIAKLEKLFQEKLLSEYSYDDKSQAWPEIFLLATDLSYGQAFRFSNNPELGGSRALGFGDFSFSSLATACAASASFPPIFGPYQLSKLLRHRSNSKDPEDFYKPYEKVFLADGGLYDNLGMNLIALGSDEFVRLFSDAGNPFQSTSRGMNSSAVVFHYMKLMSSFIAKLNFQRVKSIKKNSYAFWGCQFANDLAESSNIGYPKHLVDNYFEKVRTDLDFFDEHEAKLLENHGYAQTELALRRDFSGHYDVKKYPVAVWPYDDVQYTQSKSVKIILKRAQRGKYLSQFFRLGVKT